MAQQMGNRNAGVLAAVRPFLTRHVTTIDTFLGVPNGARVSEGRALITAFAFPGPSFLGQPIVGSMKTTAL